ncbi:MAG: alpha-2-macroglobulin family protein [Myxococcota bacterium]|nr:alpha-2-macroglobulin family protein [Myxococcota bacterium]
MQKASPMLAEEKVAPAAMGIELPAMPALPAMPPALPMQEVEAVKDRAMPAEAIALAEEEEDFGGWGLDDVVVGRRERVRREDIPAPVVYDTVRQFPIPEYSPDYQGPRTDFRETVYWNPSLRTDEQGKATVRFPLSDAVTSFRASAEGVAGVQVLRSEHVLSSKLPISIAAKLPLELSRGDILELPVSVANETERAQRVQYGAAIGPAFQLLANELPANDELAAGERRSYFIRAKVVGNGRQEADGRIQLFAGAGELSDRLERTVRIVPEGFPFEWAASGRLRGAAEHTFRVDRALPDTAELTLRFYPSPVSSLVAGTEALLRAPYGCFEQASSTTYPNIMVMQYLGGQQEVDAAAMEQARAYLDQGYQLLTGYESPGLGYEWFGGDPGHEALTAYGLMEFVQMSKVFDVDQSMIARTRKWLLDKRDGRGGYMRNPRALDAFGGASDEVTNAYITYALSEAGEKELSKEVELVAEYAAQSEDPYVLALATNTLLNVEPSTERTRTAVKKLMQKQAEDGSFPGAAQSITRSGGQALLIESTALAALAMMKSSDLDAARLDGAIGWIAGSNNGWGSFSSTQATVLALQALTQYASLSSRLPEGVRLRVELNGKQVADLSIDDADSKEMVIGGFGPDLVDGENTVKLYLEGPSDAVLAYSALASYRTKQPLSHPNAAIGLSTQVDKKSVPIGESVRLAVSVKNQRGEGQPMALARIGFPGGLSFQTWQLKELREKGLIDFYETREREVIVYFRAMAPNEERLFELDLLAQQAGSFTGPASSAYLYYTDEEKTWVEPIAMEVLR